MESKTEKEIRIELWVERAIDRLDKKFMTSLMYQEEYEAQVRAIHLLAEEKYQLI